MSLTNVFLNHIYKLIDDTTYAAIKNSDFLKKEFCHTEEKSHASENMSWKGIYLTGENTYIELFSNKDREYLHKMGCGDNGIAMHVSQGKEIEKITELFKQLDENVKFGLFEKNINNILIPWFHYVFNSFTLPKLDSWIMAYHKDYLKSKNIKNPNDKKITRKFYNATCNAVLYDKSKLFKDIEEVTLGLSSENISKLVKQQILLGYSCKKLQDYTICRSPDVTFKFKAIDNKTPRVFVLRMSLNRNIDTNKIYKLGNSTLELENQIATWTFK